MTRLGLEVNETKTRLARIPGDNITLLGYALGQFHGKEGRPYIGTRPFPESRQKLAQTDPRSNGETMVRGHL